MVHNMKTIRIFKNLPKKITNIKFLYPFQWILKSSHIVWTTFMVSYGL